MNKQGRQADEAAMDAFQLIMEEATEQGYKIIQDAKTKAAEMIKNAGEKAKAFEEKRMDEAADKIYTANDKLKELRSAAIKMKEEVERGFGSIEDEMILSIPKSRFRRSVCFAITSLSDGSCGEYEEDCSLHTRLIMGTFRFHAEN